MGIKDFHNWLFLHCTGIVLLYGNNNYEKTAIVTRRKKLHDLNSIIQNSLRSLSTLAIKSQKKLHFTKHAKTCQHSEISFHTQVYRGGHIVDEVHCRQEPEGRGREQGMRRNGSVVSLDFS